MAVRKYWRHLLGVEMAVAFPDEPRDVKVAFINRTCETKSDGDVTELIDSRSKLKKEFENFKSTQTQIKV